MTDLKRKHVNLFILSIVILLAWQNINDTSSMSDAASEAMKDDNTHKKTENFMQKVARDENSTTSGTTMTSDSYFDNHLVEETEDKERNNNATNEIVAARAALEVVNNSNNKTTTTTKEKEKKGPAIAFLVSNMDRDINNIQIALRSLDVHMHSDNYTAPVLIFNEGNLNQSTKQTIVNTTRRDVKFPLVDFTEFPAGFDPVAEQKKKAYKRSMWGYQQMCRFWILKIFEHPIIDHYSSYMRFDSDSCFVQDADSDLPGLTTDYVYHANQFKDDDERWVGGLVEFTESYVVAHNITVQNPEWWNKIKNQWYNGKGNRFRIVYNNFEVSNIAFFRQPHVMAFQKAVADGEPFGVFRRRWGDAPVRTLTLALFANSSQVKGTKRIYGYTHPCRRYEAKVIEVQDLEANLIEAGKMLEVEAASNDNNGNGTRAKALTFPELDEKLKRLKEIMTLGGETPAEEYVADNTTALNEEGPAIALKQLKEMNLEEETAQVLADNTTITTTTTENDKGPAIAFLVSNTDRDINNIQIALRSLDLHMYSDNYTAPILIFNEGNLNESTKETIMKRTKRSIQFPFVNFTEYPAGFDPVAEKANTYRRSKWGYQQMCRFWISKIWEHPILDNYSTFMRFDSDSCLVKDANSNLPGMGTDQTKKFVYLANQFKDEKAKFVDGLVEFAESYVVRHNVTVQNPNWWNGIKTKWHNNKGAWDRFKIIYNNLEVSNIAFFRQPHVMAFQNAVTDGEPFGVYRKRWGDAPVRTITLALFANGSQVLRRGKLEEGYMHPCRPYEAKVIEVQELEANLKGGKLEVDTAIGNNSSSGAPEKALTMQELDEKLKQLKEMKLRETSSEVQAG